MRYIFYLCCMEKRNNFKKTVYLCSETSPSTSTVTVFDGVVGHKDKTSHTTFIEVASCLAKAKMFKYDNDSWEDFVSKLRNLADVANEFADYCEEKYLKY